MFFRPCKYGALAIALFVFGGTHAKAQNARDSLKQVVLQNKTDTNTVNASNELAKMYRKAGLYDSALSFAESARVIAEKIKYKKGLGLAYTHLGNASKGKSNFYEALAYYEKALAIKKALNDTLGIAYANNNIGNIYRDQGKFAEALEYFFLCLRGCEAVHDTLGIAGSYNNLGLVYSFQNKDAEAIQYHRMAMEIRRKSGDLEGVAASYGNLALIYTHQKNFDEALKSHAASFAIEQQLDSKAGMASSLIGSANVYALMGKPEEALRDYEKALALSQEMGDKENISIIRVNEARLNFDNGHVVEAEAQARQSLALARQLQAMQTVKEACEIISQACQRSGRYTEALAFYKDFIGARDSLSNEENTKKTVQLEMQYQFDKKEEAAKLDQQKKDAIALADKHRQTIILVAVSGFGLLILFFAVFAYRSFLQKKRVNIEITAQKELIEEKQKEILDSIYYARRIQRSLLPSEKYVEKNLKKLNLD